MRKKRGAFFDLDRTLLSTNTGISYIKFAYNNKNVKLSDMMLAAFMFGLYKMELLDIDKMSLYSTRLLRGTVEDEIKTFCIKWFEKKGINEIRLKGRETVDKYRELGFELVLLTASMKYTAEPVANHLKIDNVLCTNAIVDNGILTGKVEWPFCLGEGKVYWARNFSRKRNIDLNQSIFYTDSFQDLPMLREVGFPVAVNPDMRLKHYAQKNNWQIEIW